MTARGVHFLDEWMANNMSVDPQNGTARDLGERLQRDAAAAGFTLDDLELEKSSIEKYIFDAMLYRAEPGTLWD